VIENGAKANAIAYLAAERELNVQLGVTGSPTVFINGASYDGGRAPEDFKTAICGAFSTAPSECSQSLGTAASSASGASCATP
jgi:hypothetical protein